MDGPGPGAPAPSAGSTGGRPIPRRLEGGLTVGIAAGIAALTAGWSLRRAVRGTPGLPEGMDAGSLVVTLLIVGGLGACSLAFLIVLLGRPRGLAPSRASPRALLATGLGGYVVSQAAAALGHLAGGRGGPFPSLGAVIGMDIGLLLAAALCREVAGRPGAGGRARAAGRGATAWVLALPLLALAGMINVLAIAALGFGAAPQAAVVALQESQGAPARVAYSLSYVVLAPIGEEWMFRGALYAALRETAGVAPGAIASGLVFGAVHGSATLVLPISLLGVLMALAYEKTGTLAAPMAFHACQNALSVTIALVSRGAAP